MFSLRFYYFAIQLILKMYNVFQRLSSITSLSMSMLMALVVLISLTTPFIFSTPTMDLQVRNIQTVTNRQMDPYDKLSRKAEHVRLTFDMEADLTSMFNWNTKVLFVYMMADYQTQNFTNRVVVWDKLVRSKRQAKIKMRKHLNKYAWRDFSLRFKESQEANLTLFVNPVPYLGIMYDKPVVSLPITIPRPIQKKK